MSNVPTGILRMICVFQNRRIR